MVQARTLWIAILLLPALAQAGPSLPNSDDLKGALHDVLAHGNLFDVEYVSDRLGLGLHLTHDEQQYVAGQNFLAVATTSPPAIFGNPDYSLGLDPEHQRSTARLSFSARACPPVQELAREWGLGTSVNLATDGGPSSVSMTWPGVDGISLAVSEGGPYCSFELRQSFKRLLPVPIAQAPPQIAPQRLATQIGDLLETDDLRDYLRVGRILEAQFILEADAQKHRLLRRGSVWLAHPIRGFTGFFDYGSEDGGWYQRAVPLLAPSGPLHPGERRAGLSLTIDVSTVCLSEQQLDLALRHQPRVQVAVADSWDGQVHAVYSVRSLRNRVSLQVYYVHGCAEELTFRQKTDFPRGVGVPLLLMLNDSLDHRTLTLTPDARHQVEFLAARLTSPVQLGGIQVAIVRGHRDSVAIDSNLAILKRRVEQQLDDAGIPIAPRPEDGSGVCDAPDPDHGPAVCVDAWLKAPRLKE